MAVPVCGKTCFDHGTHGLCRNTGYTTCDFHAKDDDEPSDLGVSFIFRKTIFIVLSPDASTENMALSENRLPRGLSSSPQKLPQISWVSTCIHVWANHVLFFL